MFSTESSTVPPPPLPPPPSSSSTKSSFSFFSWIGICGAWYVRQLDTYPVLVKSITSGCIGGIGDVICQYLQHQQHDQNEVQQQQQQQYLLQQQKQNIGQTTKATTSIYDKNDNDLSISVLPILPAAKLSYDCQRTIRFMVLGTVLVGPICHYWYRALALNLVPFVQTATATTTSARIPASIVTKRVLYDQLIFAPLFITLWTVSYKLLYYMETKMYSTFSNPSSNDVCIVVDRDSSDDLDNNPTTERIGSYLSQIEKDLARDLPEMLVVNWCLWVPAQMMNFTFIPLKYQVLFGNFVAVTWNIYLSYKATKITTTTSEEVGTITTTTTTTPGGNVEGTDLTVTDNSSL